MFKALVILSLVAIGTSNLLPQQGYIDDRVLVDSYDRPIPYAFGYDVTDEYGTNLQRSETGDGSGSVKGSYSYRDDKGITRLVDYVADKGGYRASIKTNEPGTADSDPADVDLQANPVVVDQPRLVLRSKNSNY